jgi:hypothetical protein
VTDPSGLAGSTVQENLGVRARVNEAIGNQSGNDRCHVPEDLRSIAGLKLPTAAGGLNLLPLELLLLQERSASFKARQTPGTTE